MPEAPRPRLPSRQRSLGTRRQYDPPLRRVNGQDEPIQKIGPPQKEGYPWSLHKHTPHGERPRPHLHCEGEKEGGVREILGFGWSGLGGGRARGFERVCSGGSEDWVGATRDSPEGCSESSCELSTKRKDRGSEGVRWCCAPPYREPGVVGQGEAGRDLRAARACAFFFFPDMARRLVLRRLIRRRGGVGGPPAGAFVGTWGLLGPAVRQRGRIIVRGGSWGKLGGSLGPCPVQGQQDIEDCPYPPCVGASAWFWLAGEIIGFTMAIAHPSDPRNTFPAKTFLSYSRTPPLRGYALTI